MSGSIGSFNFSFLDGEPPSKHIEITDISAAGEDGNATLNRGQRADVVRLIGRTFSSTAGAIKTNITNYKNAVGDIVSYTDDIGNTYTNMEIINVRTIPGPGNTGRIELSTTGQDWMHTTEWHLQEK